MVTAHRVADTDATVLITGESGTGKEVLAQAIHNESNRGERTVRHRRLRGHPARRCSRASCSDTSAAPSPGRQARPGKGALPAATGGTILLDEIGELPLDCSPSCSGSCRRGSHDRSAAPAYDPVDVPGPRRHQPQSPREVSSRPVPRGPLLPAGGACRIDIPPLRERQRTCRAARALPRHFGPQYRRPSPGPARAEVDGGSCMRYAWPGNIRELQNRILRAVIMSNGETLTLEALSLPSERSGSTPSPIEASFEAVDQERDGQGTADGRREHLHRSPERALRDVPGGRLDGLGGAPKLPRRRGVQRCRGAWRRASTIGPLARKRPHPGPFEISAEWRAAGRRCSRCPSRRSSAVCAGRRATRTWAGGRRNGSP